MKDGICRSIFAVLFCVTASAEDARNSDWLLGQGRELDQGFVWKEAGV